jgi:hypothetical protein
MIKNRFSIFLLVLIFSCQDSKKNDNKAAEEVNVQPQECCVITVPDRFNGLIKTANSAPTVNIDSLKKTNPVFSGNDFNSRWRV